MKVLICGARDYKDYIRMDDFLDKWIGKISVVIHGGAKGADTMAGEWAKSHGIPVEIYSAQWRRYGRAAGPIRNKQMLNEGKPSMVIAFPGTKNFKGVGKGTGNMMKQAIKARIKVIHVTNTHHREEL